MMRTICAITLPALLYTAAAWAQAAGSGSITGMIRDVYGDGLPDTKIVVSNPSLGFSRTIMTSDDGLFLTGELPPAAGYALGFGRKGFASKEIKDVQVLAGQRLELNLTLEATASSEGEAGLVLPARVDGTQGVNGQIGPRELDALPAAGRQWSSLALVAPGVAPGNAAGQIAIRGEAVSNAISIDGTDVTFRLAPKAVSRTLSLDAAQEFQVSAVPTAETGGAMGGRLNAVTRSGGAEHHGSVYEYFRNASLAAADRYSLGRDLRGRQHQAGFSVGGPAGRGLFYFANFELLDGKSNTLNRVINPALTDAAGISLLASNCNATAAQCSAAMNFLNPQLNVTVPRSNHAVNGFGRLDYRANERQTVSLSLGAMNWRSNNGVRNELVSNDGGLLGGNADAREQTRFAGASWTAAGDATVNQLRLGWSHDRWAATPATGLYPSTGALGINIAGMMAGAAPEYPAVYSEQRYQAGDDVTRLYNSHAFKFGLAVSATADRVAQSIGQAGIYTYNSLTDFAADFSGNTSLKKNYSLFQQSISEDSARHWVSKEFSVYFQDTFRLRPNLTVDYGLRWEKPFLPKPRWVNNDYWVTGRISAPNIDYAPRLGVAYLMGQKTTLRMGYGMYYAPFSGNVLKTLLSGGQSSVVATPAQTGAPVFPNLYTDISNLPKGVENITYASGRFRNPYSKQFTLSLARELGSDVTVSASYIRSAGTKLWSSHDLNLTAPTKSATYAIQDENGVKTGEYTTKVWTAKSDSRYGRIYEIENQADSWYNALALELRTRARRGFTVNSTYTLSDAKDNFGSGMLTGGNTADLGYDSDKGISSSNQRHRATIRWTWQPRLVDGPARRLVNGWELSGIVTLASGRPATPLVLATGQQFAGIVPVYANTLNGSGGWTRAPFLGVNSLITQAQRTVDARVSRTFAFTERLKGALTLEAYNAFNSKYDTGVNTIGYVASNGVIRALPGLGDGNSTASYPDGTNARRAQIALRLSF